MNIKTFTRFIEGLEKYQNKRDKAYKLGIDILDFDQDYYREVIRPLMSEVFKEEGMDWINWYLYERVSFDGTFLEAFDALGNPICYNVASLYDTIKEYLK